MWTAGQRQNVTTESEFVWNPFADNWDLQEAVDYTCWDRRQPNYKRFKRGGKEACLALKYRRKGRGKCHGLAWHDARCEAKFCFLCELNK